MALIMGYIIFKLKKFIYFGKIADGKSNLPAMCLENIYGTKAK